MAQHEAFNFNKPGMQGSIPNPYPNIPQLHELKISMSTFMALQQYDTDMAEHICKIGVKTVDDPEAADSELKKVFTSLLYRFGFQKTLAAIQTEPSSPGPCTCQRSHHVQP